MAFSPRKQQINRHLANRQRNKKNKPALHRCNASEMASVGGRNGAPAQVRVPGQRLKTEGEEWLSGSAKTKSKSKNGVAWSFIRKN